MKRGDKVRHKDKQHQYKGVGEVTFVSASGLVFVKWPQAEVKTWPAYYKAASLMLVGEAQ